MPIKFRCQKCRQFLGISRSQAGQIVDCPTCGRATRVPNLDGTLAPLPKNPGIDAKDSSLLKALDRIAGLAGGAAAADEAEVTEKTSAAPAVANGEDSGRPLAPTAQPVVLDPPEPTEPTRAVVAPTEKKPVNTDAVLDQLAATAVVHEPEEEPVAVRFQWWPLIVGAVLFVAGFAGGMMVPRDAPPAETRETAEDATQAVPPVETDTPQESRPAIRGRVTCLTGDGECRPDRGARVLALPTDAGFAERLAIAGFRPGAAPADAADARNLLQSLGGDVATVDDRGEYALDLSGGDYQVLIISRSSRRRDDVPVTPHVSALSPYFEQAQKLLGQSQFFRLKSFKFRGEDVQLLDHVFDVAG